ncbi:NAD-dependent epimerase/dehydratase family protein, partial [Candidatus Pelagibacter sp.]|nr:NAD-dependent epimerase/dehydratase family protein [Candidatus Pelagibacter sp.]
GFIGGYLVSKLIKKNFNVICCDIKPKNKWFQIFSKSKKFYSTDLNNFSNCLKVTKRVDYVFNLACNMGGMGFIENNKAACMTSVLINTNLLNASKINKVKKYMFTSSACVYNSQKQKHTKNPGLKEKDAYPADPEDGYGWEKLFSERMCRHYKEDYGLDVRVVRLHNVYGPLGTFEGGREKAPAALCRKIAEAKIKKNKIIEVWGDGKQTRSFMFITDCINGILKIFRSNYFNPVNLGSSQRVTINQMINMIEKIANYKIKKKYLKNKPKGVRGRSSDNKLIKKILNWEPDIKLDKGLKYTYNWIYSEITKKNNLKKF